MAKLSLKSVLGSNPTNNCTQNAVNVNNQNMSNGSNTYEIQQQHDNYEIKRLQLQNKQLAMRNEKLLQQVAVLQNEMSNAHQQLTMLRNKEARMKGSFRKSIGAIRGTIISKFGDLMAQFDSDVDQLGIGYEHSTYLPIGYHGVSSSNTHRTLPDPAGYLKGMNDYIHQRIISTSKNSSGSELTVYGQNSDKNDRNNENGNASGVNIISETIQEKEQANGDTSETIPENEQVDDHAFEPILEESSEESSSDANLNESPTKLENPPEEMQSENSSADTSKFNDSSSSNLDSTGATSISALKVTDTKDVKLLPAPYEDAPENVPQKKEPVTLSPLGESITKDVIPILSFSEKDKGLTESPQSPEKSPIFRNTEDKTEENAYVANSSEANKSGTSYSTVEEPELDLMDGIDSGEAQFESESARNEEDDEQNGVTNVPLTENPFKDPRSKTKIRIVRSPRKKQQRRRRKRLSGLSRELKNLQFEMPLSWRDQGGEKPRKVEKRRNSLVDSDLESEQEPGDVSIVNIEADNSGDDDYKSSKPADLDPVDVMATSARRRKLFMDGPISKKRRITDYGKSSQKLNVLKDVTNNLDRNSSGNSSRRSSKKTGGSIFDLLDEEDGNRGENNKENVVPSKKQSKKIRQTTNKRRRKRKSKKSAASVPKMISV